MIALHAAGADGLPPAPARSLRLEGGLDPLHGLLLLHQHHVETARRRRRQAPQVMLRRKNDAPLFGRADAAAGPAKGAVGAVAHFYEHQGAVPVAQHQVDLAAAAAGRPIIARHELQSGGGQVGEGEGLGGMAALAGSGCAGGRRGRSGRCCRWSLSKEFEEFHLALLSLPPGVPHAMRRLRSIIRRAPCTWWPRPSATWPTSRCARCICCNWPTPWPARTSATRRPCCAPTASTRARPNCWPCTSTTRPRPRSNWCCGCNRASA